MIEDTLPNKPSELIRVALRDLCKAEQTPWMRVNMSLWVSVRNVDGDEEYLSGGPNTCVVCLAGAAVVGSVHGFDDGELREDGNVVKLFSDGEQVKHHSCSMNFDSVPWSVNRKMPFLNSCRHIYAGEYLDGLWNAWATTQKQVTERIICDERVPPYETDRDGFFRVLNKVADIYESVGC